MRQTRTTTAPQAAVMQDGGGGRVTCGGRCGSSRRGGWWLWHRPEGVSRGVDKGLRLGHPGGVELSGGEARKHPLHASGSRRVSRIESGPDQSLLPDGRRRHRRCPPGRGGGRYPPVPQKPVLAGGRGEGEEGVYHRGGMTRRHRGSQPTKLERWAAHICGGAAHNGERKLQQSIGSSAGGSLSDDRRYPVLRSPGVHHGTRALSCRSLLNSIVALPCRALLSSRRLSSLAHCFALRTFVLDLG